MRALTAALVAILAIPSAARAQGPVGLTPEVRDPGAAARAEADSTADERRLRELPRFVSAVDTVTSAPPAGPLPELAAPGLDMIAASLQASQNGAVVHGVFAPFLFLDEPSPVISEMRVDVHGGSSGLQPWGFVVSTGYSRASDKLWKWRPTPAQRDAFSASCATTSEVELRARIMAAVALAARINATAAADDPGRVTLQGDAKEWPNQAHRAYQRLKNASLKSELAPLERDLERAVNAAGDKYGECWIKAANAARIKDAYSSGWAVRAFGGADFFPFVSGPRVAPKEGEPLQEAVPHVMAGWTAGGTAGYFPTRNTRVWLTGSYTQKRAKPTIEKTSTRWGLGADLAGNIPVGAIDSDGFQPGLAFGGFGSVQTCIDKEGCDEAVFGYADPVKAKRITVFGAFLDFRASAKVQLRVSMPVTVYSLASAPARSDGGTSIVGIAPTVSITVASWTLSPKTEF